MVAHPLLEKICLLCLTRRHAGVLAQVPEKRCISSERSTWGESCSSLPCSRLFTLRRFQLISLPDLGLGS